MAIILLLTSFQHHNNGGSLEFLIVLFVHLYWRRRPLRRWYPWIGSRWLKILIMWDKHKSLLIFSKFIKRLGIFYGLLLICYSLFRAFVGSPTHSLPSWSEQSFILIPSFLHRVSERASNSLKTMGGINVNHLRSPDNIQRYTNSSDRFAHGRNKMNLGPYWGIIMSDLLLDKSKINCFLFI